MSVNNKIHKMWTKQDMAVILKSWDKLNTSDIAEQLGRTPGSVSGMAGLMRKNGIDVPKKRKNGYIHTLIADFKKELKVSKKLNG